MKTYDNKEMKDIEWTKFKIVVPTQEDKEELLKAFKHIHDSDINTNYVAVNQLAHQYLSDNNIVVDEKLYKKIK